jgi:hypothetical protein
LVSLYEVSGCKLSCAGSPPLVGCTDIATSCANLPSYTRVTASQPAGTECTPSATPTPTPTSWATNVLGCNPPGNPTSCDSQGGVCVVESASYQTCVYKAGTNACPSGFQSTQLTIYTAVDDMRSCSACMCTGTPDLSCSGGSVVLGAGMCSGAAAMADAGTPVDDPSSCSSLPVLTPMNGAIYAEVVTQPTPAAKCSDAAGGTIMGTATVDQSSAITVCCL